MHHFRTEGGRQEIDCIVEVDGAATASEVKLAGTVDPTPPAAVRWIGPM